MSKRILAIHAHPDDLEILAAGTLALLAARGHDITIVTMTPGDKGSDDHSKDEISEIRAGEARNAAQLIGARYYCAHFADLEIFNNDPSRKRVVEVLRRFAPDVVITASPVDYLCDHEITSMLVRDACFAAQVPNYSTGTDNAAAALSGVPHLYFADPVDLMDRDGQPVKPDFVVNVESTFEKKCDMLAAHKSQRTWLQRRHGIDDYLLMMERSTRCRGESAGLTFGEGFRRYKGHPYPQTPLLEELLAPDCVA